MDKQGLRSRMRSHRRRLAREHPGAAEDAAGILRDYLSLKTFPAVGLYHPAASEFDPRPLAAGSRYALPVVTTLGGPLVFRQHKAGDQLTGDLLGILAPGPEAREVWPDLVVVPVLAFDRQGGRLGQGGGYYDRTLEQLRARKAVLVIGVAYAGQEVEETPMEPHDQRLDAILTEKSYIEADWP